MIVADLQELVDDLAELIGRPISVEDRRWRLLAHSAHERDVDDVRRASILARHAPPDVAAWLDSLELHRARAPVDVPANPEFGMVARRAAPLRHGDAALGVVWVIVGDDPLSAEDERALERTAALAQDVLWARRRDLDEGRAEVARLLADVFDGGGSHAVLAAALGWGEPSHLAVAVFRGDDDVAERLRRHWPAGDLAWARRGPMVAVLARLAPAAAEAGLGQAAAQAGAPAAGVSAPITMLAEAPRALRQAEVALIAGEALGERLAAWDGLGAWAAITDLWDAAGRPEPDPDLAAFFTEHETDLVPALEAALDHAGDVAEAADALHVHRTTLYRRLDRVKELTGHDPFDGDDRLALHLALRIWRLGDARQL